MTKNQYTSIAIVSTQQITRNILEHVLQFLGNNVSVLCSDSQAFLINTRKNGPPDICLLDCELHETDGFTITKIIKKTWPQAKVILFGLRDNKRNIQRAISSGADVHLDKGTDVRQLKQILEQLAFPNPTDNKIFSYKTKTGL